MGAFAVIKLKMSPKAVWELFSVYRPSLAAYTDILSDPHSNFQLSVDSPFVYIIGLKRLGGPSSSNHSRLVLT